MWCCVESSAYVESVMMYAMIGPLWSSKVKTQISECAFMSAVMMVLGICVKRLIMLVMSDLIVVFRQFCCLLFSVGVTCILVSCASVYIDMSVFGVVSSVNVMLSITSSITCL